MEEQYFFTRVNPVSVESVILAAYRLHDNTPDAVSPISFFAPFKAILTGQYPIFNKYPEFIVNYQNKMKEKIRVDEEDYLRRRCDVTVGLVSACIFLIHVFKGKWPMKLHD
jgi:hypothetical protein